MWNKPFAAHFPSAGGQKKSPDAKTAATRTGMGTLNEPGAWACAHAELGRLSVQCVGEGGRKAPQLQHGRRCTCSDTVQPIALPGATASQGCGP